MSWAPHPAGRHIIVVSWLRKLATSLRCPFMESWQLFPRYFETMHILFKRGIVSYQFEHSSSVYFHPSWSMFVSQLKRWFNVSFRELIMVCLIFVKIESCRASLSFPCRVGWRSRKQRCQDQYDAMNQHLREEQLDQEDGVSFVPPPCLLTSRLESRDEILV